MAFFPRAFVNNNDVGSFAPLFRLLDDFETHSRSNFNRPNGTKLISPKFDVKELPEQYELHGEFPGLEQKNISLEFTDPQTLTVRAHQEYESSSGPAIEEPKASGAITDSAAHQPTVEDANDEEGTVSKSTQPEASSQQVAQKSKGETVPAKPKEQYHVHERTVGEYYRQFQFPGRIDQDGVKASMQNGILSVIVPKAKKHEARRIAIQ